MVETFLEVVTFGLSEKSSMLFPRSGTHGSDRGKAEDTVPEIQRHDTNNSDTNRCFVHFSDRKNNNTPTILSFLSKDLSIEIFQIINRQQSSNCRV